MSEVSRGEDEKGKGKGKSLSNVSTISKLISNRLEGISPLLIELMIATMTKDKGGIKTSLGKLSLETNIDQEFLDCIVNLGISDFNPSDYQRQPSFGQV